ncbi:MAG TPA: PaaI family thioesterase [Thermoleophilaceae bacterium]|nr:PaaI family thioesterase [Thermoleophilaceae bacterium]
MSDVFQTLDGTSSYLGLRWDSPEVVRMTIRPELINLGGLLSGVATYGMIDYGMGRALWMQTAEDEAIATVNISINYVQTATEGDLVCTTTVDRRNRRLAVMRAEVLHEDGRLIATAIGSYTIFPRRTRPRPGG